MSLADVSGRNVPPSLQVALSDGRGHDWIGDEPVDKGGGDQGPTPEELLASSLATCTAATLRVYARHKQLPLEDVRVTVRFDPQQRGADGTIELTRDIEIAGALDEHQRRRLIEIAERCPMHKVLTGGIRIATRESATHV